MNTIPRHGGVALLVYGVGVTASFLAIGSPGGNYDPGAIASYVSSGHWPSAFALAYLGALSSVGLMVFGHAVRGALGGTVGDLGWGLGVAGTTAGVVGGFLVAGIDVAMAEGGTHVQDGLSQPVVYTLSEVGNLVSVCGPAFFAGLLALVLAVKGPLPTWLRAFAGVAGICGILAPLFFTYFVFVIWTVVAGATLAARRTRHSVGQPAPSLV
jgi:hypothetical protein